MKIIFIILLNIRIHKKIYKEIFLYFTMQNDFLNAIDNLFIFNWNFNLKNWKFNLINLNFILITHEIILLNNNFN